MNWEMLLYFLRKVVPSGEHETEELLKCYNFVQQIIEHEAA
jgi:hypothetical protein